MLILDQPRMWLRALLVRRQVESEMEREMRLHLDLETQHNVERGMSPGEARRRAMLAFGGVERAKESVRDERLTRWLEELAADFRLALRGFRRQPAYTIGIITLIALGIGPNAAIFSVVNHTLLSPIPFRDGNRMVALSATAGGGRILSARTKADVDLWRARARTVESITFVDPRQYTLGDTARGPTERVRGVAFGPGATAFTGLHPLIGRDIEPSDTLAAAPPVVLLSYALWQRLFGGQADAIGRSVVLNQLSHTVIGVMPERFTVPFWAGSSQLFTALRGVRPDHEAYAIAKLRPGESVADANRELAAMFPKRDASKSEDAPFVERAIDRVGASSKRTIYLIFGAVSLVLLIACANVANLMVARAWTRQREFTIRSAMGARRSRLIRHVLVESVTLSLCGGTLGIAFAFGTLALLNRVPEIAWQIGGARMEPIVLAWVFSLSIATGVLFGIAPALFVSATRHADALKAGSSSVAGHPSSRRLRAGLVIGEIALSVVLLVSSGLLIRTISAMQRADMGFQPAGLYGVEVLLRDTSFSDSTARHAALQLVLDRVRAVPGVRAATYSIGVPPDGVIGVGQLEIEGASVLETDSLATSNLSVAWPNVFAVLGVHILRGRAFNAYSDQSEIVVNDGFARRFFPNGQAVGGRIRRSGGPWATVVGIANDIDVPGAPNRINATHFYLALGAAPKSPTLLFRSDLPLARVAPVVTEAIRTANPRIKLGRTSAADDLVAGARGLQRFTLRMIGAFAVLALILVAFGLHATIAYSVSQRTRELGIRMVLGAQSHNVMELVLGQAIKLTAAGLIVGVYGGFLAGRALRALLFHVAPLDPLSIGAVGVILVAVSLLASYAPARRAASVDPAETLRAE